MIETLIDPKQTLIVPPMDVESANRGSEPMSAFPLRLRTNRGVGFFGARRDDAAGGLVRFHAGVDLLAPQGEKVFAAAAGNVVLVNNITGGTIIAIHHFPLELGVVTRYIHLQNPLVAVGTAAAPTSVDAGQQIGEVGPPAPVTHLHFELRQLFTNATTGVGGSGSSHPLDPTRVLYDWEVNRFTNDATTRHIEDNATISNVEDIVRDRMLRLFLVNVAGKTDDFFVPIYDPTPSELLLIATVKEAFFRKCRVRLVWRESLFFADIQSPKAKLLAEVKVYG